MEKDHHSLSHSLNISSSSFPLMIAGLKAVGSVAAEFNSFRLVIIYTMY